MYDMQHVVGLLVLADRGVVHEHVDAPVAGHGPVDHVLGEAALAEVAAQVARRGRVRLAQAHQSLQARLAPRDRDHAGAAPRELAGGDVPDARRCAGEHHHLVPVVHRDLRAPASVGRAGAIPVGHELDRRRVSRARATTVWCMTCGM
jgi:hypothetical protein